jgi:hypothetical protein
MKLFVGILLWTLLWAGIAWPAVSAETVPSPFKEAIASVEEQMEAHKVDKEHVQLSIQSLEKTLEGHNPTKIRLAIKRLEYDRNYALTSYNSIQVQLQTIKGLLGTPGDYNYPHPLTLKQQDSLSQWYAWQQAKLFSGQGIHELIRVAKQRAKEIEEAKK